MEQVLDSGGGTPLTGVERLWYRPFFVRPLGTVSSGTLFRADGFETTLHVFVAGDGLMAIHPIEQVLVELNSEGVRYLVVGGVAVVLHGHLRTTADLDLVLALTPENVRRAIIALERLGFRPRAPVPAMDFVDPDKRAVWLRDKGLTAFSLWSEQIAGIEVDLFVEEPFDFEQAYVRAVRVNLDTTWTIVASLDDLIALKRASGRPLDLADVEALEAIAGRREEPG